MSTFILPIESLSPVHTIGWKRNDLARVQTCSSFRELSAIALEILSRYPEGTRMISGPMVTGGRFEKQANFDIYAATVENLVLEQLIPVFSPVAFEPTLQRLKNEWVSHGNTGYCAPIITDFYFPLFESGMVAELDLIYGWWTSNGSLMEVAKCQSLGIRTVELGFEHYERICTSLKLLAYHLTPPQHTPIPRASPTPAA